MIEVKLLTDIKKVEEICKESGLQTAEYKNVLRATENGETIGYSVFSIDEKSLTIERVFPSDDVLLADGIIRSTLHIAVERGITDTFYTDGVSEKLLSMLKLVKNSEKKMLDTEILFKDCCCK